MKSKVFHSLFLVITLILPACKDKREIIQTFYEPVYLSYNDLRTPVTSTQPVSLQKPGKIYIKDPLIFINEYMEGIHIIDNSDPANPQVLGFLEIPGNVDMAVNGSVLFADSYVDIVALDISDPENITETGRGKKILPYIIPPTDGDYEIDWDEVNEEKGVITGWEVKRVRKELENTYFPPPFYPVYLNYTLSLEKYASPVPASSGGTGTGTGGSMARFTIVNNWLYALTTNNLLVIDITNPQQINKTNQINPGWDMETIFPYENYLFLGSRSGMSIYDISSPATPVFVSRYNHMVSCDPVVVQNDMAYITLRAGNECGATTSRLDIIDLSDISSPTLDHSILMNNPYGLAIHDSLLYICEGEWGLKVYNATNPRYPFYLQTIYEIHAWDIIAWNDLLMVIGEDGLSQYKVSNFNTIQQISSIPVNNSN